MEGVEKLVTVKAKHRDTEVQHIVLECPVLQEEINVKQICFQLRVEIAVVSLPFD